MSEVIQAGKYVELTYKVTDRKTGHVLTRVEFPLGYVHGHNEILAPAVHAQLEGKAAGEIIEVTIDGNDIFGAPDAGREGWTFGIPSIWVWQILFWLLGVAMMWFLAYKMELSSVPQAEGEALVEDIGDTSLEKPGA